MTDQDYIGTDLSKLPEGTVAVVKYHNQRRAFVRKVCCGGVYCVDEELKATHVDPDPNPATVIAIIKLGTPRPKTFTDVPAYEAWEYDGSLLWHDGTAMLYADSNNQPSVAVEPDRSEYHIVPTMHRVGMITGVMIDGKPYIKESK